MTVEHTKSLATPHIRPPPLRVLWFERLFYASAFLSIIVIALDWSSGMHVVTFSAIYVLFCTKLALIWFAARRRKNWARWLLLAFFLVWVVSGIVSAGLNSRLPNWQPPPIPLQAITLAKILLEDIGLILIFTGSARRWFNVRSAHHDPHRAW